MLRVLFPNPLLLTLLGLLVVSACDSDEASPTDSSSRAAAGPPSTIILDIELPADTSPAELTAIAHTAEHTAGSELRGARVEIEQTDGGATSLSVTVWGTNLAEPEAIISKLRAEHPALATAQIETSTHAGAPADQPIVRVELDESPAQAEARIIAKLREQGVAGEISVNVIDEDQGRRIEVHVEDQQP